MTQVGAGLPVIVGRVLCLVALAVAVGCNGDGSSSASATSASTRSTSSLSISGTPAAQAPVGQAYAFRPVVTAAASTASVGFSIQNKPLWATFNTSSGQLSGTPSSSDVGSYPNIVIGASNGSASAALAGFTITVPKAGTVTLDWQAPSANTDGSPLTDVAGYTIQYGTIESLLTQSTTVDSQTTSHTLENLTPGVWYFAVSAYTSDGIQGALSEVVSTTVQ